VVAVVFESNFYLEMYQNNIFFYFLKIIFEINALKYLKKSKNNNLNKKILNLLNEMSSSIFIFDSFLK